ncbi:MAG: YicC family protein, partial [Chitinispirillaceae bacterium]|nr:YicC family protein [Chitinispirillaceae bacterium]
MPIKSMTGFGLAEANTPSGTYHVEIRGVNNRFLEMQVRLPRFASNLEQQIRKEVSGSISRGSVTVAINCDSDESGTKVSWDREAVDNYLRIFKEIKTQYKLEGDITLSQLFSFSNIVKTGSVSFTDELIWSHLKPVILEAVAAFQKTREKEAAFLVKELRITLKNIDKTLKLIEKRVPERKQDYVRNLQDRIKKLCATEPDQTRIATEIALMADRLDISEECTRLRAHIAKFSEDFSANEPVGKRMGFLLQEMNRESNTIGSKA